MAHPDLFRVSSALVLPHRHDARFFRVLYLLGKFIAARVGHGVWGLFERGVLNVPVIRPVYSSVKQVSDFLLSEREIQYTRVVALEYPRKGVWALGFVTGESMSMLAEACLGAGRVDRRRRGLHLRLPVAVAGRLVSDRAHDDSDVGCRTHAPGTAASGTGRPLPAGVDVNAEPAPAAIATIIVVRAKRKSIGGRCLRNPGPAPSASLRDWRISRSPSSSMSATVGGAMLPRPDSGMVCSVAPVALRITRWLTSSATE